MKSVLRNTQGEITHVYYTTQEGTNIYLSKEANEKMYDFSQEQVDEYYSGEAETEVESLKEDLTDILNGELNLKWLKYRIAIHSEYIRYADVMEING